MKYFQCPKCRLGLYNATQAILDRSGHCRCGTRFIEVRPARKPPIGSQCSVTGPTGQRYCSGKPVSSTFCSRHKYLSHSHGG